MKKQYSPDIFSHFFENSIDMLCIIGLDGHFVKINPEWEKTLGYPASELEGKNFSEFVHPDDAEKTKLAADQLVQKRSVDSLVNRCRHRDGSYRWIEWRAFPVEDRIYASARNITTQKLTEAEMRESEEKFRSIVENALAGIFIINEDFNVVYVNDEMCRISGRNREELMGSDFRKVLTSKSLGIVVDRYIRRQKGETVPSHYDLEAVRGDGQIRMIEMTVNVIKDHTGTKLSMGQIIDITERKKAEDALQKRVLALTQPLDNPESVKFTDLFNVEELQRIQDTFADATGVASLITYPDGTPITKPSNFCQLCQIIRSTEKGMLNCSKSDEFLGSLNIAGPTIKPCLSGGLWDAAANITLGGVHLANWLIGQVRNEALDDDGLLKYADEIGADRNEFENALKMVPVMPEEQFEKVSQSLFILARELSTKAYQNVQQARFIADLKKSEEALRKSEEQFRSMAQNIPGVVFQCTAIENGDIRLNYISNLAHTYLGFEYTEGENFFGRLLEKIAEEDRPGFLSSVRSAISNGLKWEWEGKYIKPLGEVIYLRGSAQPRQGFSERIFDGVIYDITERKVAQERDREKAERAHRQRTAIINLTLDKAAGTHTRIDKFRMLAEEAARTIGVERTSIWLFSGDKKELTCAELFESESQKHSQGLVLHTKDYPHYFGALKKESRICVADARNDPRTREFTEGYLVPLGINSMLDAVIHTRGTLSGVVCLEHTGEIRKWESDEEAFASLLASLAAEIIIDEDRKQAEEALKRSEESLSRASHMARIGSMELDLKRDTGYFSEELFRLFDLDPEKGVPKFDDFIQVIHPDDRHLIVDSNKPRPESERSRTFEYRSNPARGPVRHFLSFNEMVYDPVTKSRNLIVTIQDITERKMAEAEILKLNQDLEKKVEERTIRLNEAIRDLESFAYSVSHDLRAPIRHIDGFLKLMAANIVQPDETVTGYYHKIENATLRMSAMIDSLLNFSRLGRKELSLSIIDMKELVYEIIELNKPDIGNRNIRWNILPLPSIQGDRNLIKLAFENIISNAIKYTARKTETRIDIGSNLLPDDRVEFFIKDNGIGFDMAYASKLFGVFQRLHNNEQFEGIGIGLANVKQIVEKHNGTIRAEGKPDKGTVIYVTLPISKSYE